MEFVEYTIGELALEVRSGKTPPTSNPEYFDGDIPWIGPSDLKGQKLADDSERKISEMALEDRKAFLYQSGTVLISTIGDIGKTAIVKKPIATNQQLTGILVNEDLILPELFYYWIRLNKDILENKANTAVISMLNNKLLKRVKVVFPKGFEDQYKIVGRLNRIQELIDKRVDTINLLEKYIQSIFLERFGDPYLNKRKFERKRLNTLIESNSVITRGIDQPGPNIENGIPYIKSGDIKDGKILTNQLKKTSVEIASKNENSKCSYGDLVISIRATVGSIAMIPEELEGVNLSRGTARIVLNRDSVSNYFIYYLLSTNGIQTLINQQIKGSTFKQITLSKLRQLALPIPAISLQLEFESIFIKVEKIRKQLEVSLNFLKTLFQSTLQDAFSEESQINEDEVFESLLKTFTKEDLKQGNRLKHLLKWINCKEPRFSQFESYDLAWDRLRELLEDGSIEQVLYENEIKLKVAE